MAIPLEQELRELINRRDVIKVLATTGEDGSPHAVVKQSIQVNERGEIEYLELLESSESYRNVTRSLWFNQRVSVTVKGDGDASFQIKGRPVRIRICGPEFEQRYREVRARLGDVDLAAVCIIIPEEVREESYSVRFREQSDRLPVFAHLDRLAK